MSNTLKTLMRGSAASDPYVDDVFSAYTYTGNGSTQTINNGIDLAGKGGMVWTKIRSVANDHFLVDTVRGGTVTSAANRSDIGELTTSPGLTFSSSGYDLPSNFQNAAPHTFVSWTFRKAAKFFDVVTYTGDGTSNRQIAHSLGVAPGMVIVKMTSTSGGWWVYHRSLSANNYLKLENTVGSQSGGVWGDGTEPTSTHFTVNNGGEVNAAGASYVAYLFAHDTGTDGIIQCGSFTTTGSEMNITLGWEPQYVLLKGSSGTFDWSLMDTARGLDNNGLKELYANSSIQEQATTRTNGLIPTATGFKVGSWYPASTTYVYLAIRRPNKPPTSGTQVYNAIARTGTGAAATVTGVGFAPDLVISGNRANSHGASIYDRLRGALKVIWPNSTGAEYTRTTTLLSFSMDGVGVGVDTDGDINKSTWTYINHFFRRAPGFFDVVCYTGTGAALTVNHSLGVVPELMIVKSRSGAYGWPVYHKSLGNQGQLALQQTAAAVSGQTIWDSKTPTASVFYLDGSWAGTNGAGATYVAYLFATKAGISYVGSYTGNGGTAGSAGTSQTINCGFSAGARFVMLKCTSHASDWRVVDTVRGLVAGNDPALSLNTTAAEVTTTDLLDPDSSGFVVNQLASGTTSADFNVTGRTYLVLAFA